VPHPIIQRPDEEMESTPEGPTPETDAPTADAHLAGFALLADPGTIAGEVAPAAADAQAEVERLRAALHLRSQEIEALQAKWSGPGADASEPDTKDEVEDSSEGRGALLDAASARRLAADARRRERESRAALEAAQKALGTEPTAPQGNAVVPPESTGWQQRALVARSPSETTEAGPPTAEASASPAAEANVPAANATPARAELDPDDTLRALGRELRVVRAENRERESTLALARETTRRQREEIERLRAALAELDRATAEPRDEAAPTTPPAAVVGDTTVRALDGGDSLALAARVTALEAELVERDGERTRLEAAVAEARAQDAQRRDQIDALQDRLEAQDRALDAARREYELERQRHTRSRGLIARLRATLAAAAPDESLFEDEDPLTRTAAPVVAVEPDVGEAAPAPETTAPDVQTGGVERLPVVDPGTQQEVVEASRTLRRAEARLFDDWLDGQVRRHFGPMGIDRLSDLLIGPLARRTSAVDGEPTVLLLGRNAWSRAAALAEGLVGGRSAPVAIHVADPVGGPDDLDLDADSPVRELLVAESAPEDATALARLLDSLRPAFVICHDLLSHEESPDAWLDALEGATDRRAALLFVETTGVGPIEAPEEVRAVGDRIWSLLPERYASLPGEAQPYPSWSAAFERAPCGVPNGLFEALRSRFRPELSARFGFLIAPFLHAGLAANFDADAERDQRFLAQVADLDERRVESGEAPALHGIVLVDPLAED